VACQGCGVGVGGFGGCGVDCGVGCGVDCGVGYGGVVVVVVAMQVSNDSNDFVEFPKKVMFKFLQAPPPLVKEAGLRSCEKDLMVPFTPLK